MAHQRRTPRSTGLPSLWKADLFSFPEDPGTHAAMPGNMTKAQALEWLIKYGSTVRGYPQEAAAAYLNLGVARFRADVAAGRLPQPERHGKRLVWDRVALD